MATKARQIYTADEETLHKDKRTLEIESGYKTKIDGIEDGAQVNVIEGVKVNGTQLIPDAQKNVNVEVPIVVDNIYTADSEKALSANMGKQLSDEIESLKSTGRFLSFWNAVAGKPTSEPPQSPYTYHTGDYYIVDNVAPTGGTNYRPEGTSYSTGDVSTTVETQLIVRGSMYFFDGEDWLLHASGGGGGTAQWGQITGTLSNQTDLQGVLDSKITNPASGTAGQVLTKTASGEAWQDVDGLPSQTGKSGKFLTTDGTDASWEDIPEELPSGGTTGQVLTKTASGVAWDDVDGLPDQTGKNGKYLTTNGTTASWEDAGDMKYTDFNFSEKAGTTLTLGLSSLVKPIADFTVNAPTTIKDGQIYILRVENNGVAYAMTLGTNITDPYDVDYTLTDNAIDQFAFLGVDGKLELQPIALQPGDIPEVPVEDVKVDGTSVVDANKVAQIDLSGKADKTYVDQQLRSKQDALNPENAGSNITITTSGGGDLPVGYTQLLYIENTASAQIDTGIPFEDDVSLNVSLAMTQHDGGGIVGYRFTSQASATGNMRFFYVNTSGNITARLGASATAGGPVLGIGNRVEFYFDGTKGYIDGTEFTVGNKSTTSDFGNVCLFLINTTGYYSTDIKAGKFKLYSCSIQKGGVEVRRLIPAKRNNDNAVGLYDAVNGVFYTSSTEGLVAGPDFGNLVVISATSDVTDVKVDGTSVVTNKVANIDLSGKQDTLTAGHNITITNNTIDSVDELPSGGTAGQVLTKTSSGTAWQNVSGGDMQYSDFEFSQPTGNTVTLSLSTEITPSANFTVNAPSTVKEGMAYILRVTNGATPVTMTLGTGIENPSEVDLTLTANAIDQFSFLGLSDGTLELQPGGSGDSLPDQTGNAGKFLQTNGTEASWQDVNEFMTQEEYDTNHQASRDTDHITRYIYEEES